MKLTEAQRQSYRDHPEYSEGFYDAQCGDPLFDDATDPYRAGWEAFYVCKEIMDHNGFSRTADGSFEKSFTIGRALRDFVKAELADDFKQEWKSSNEWQTKPDPYDFLPWLVESGRAIDADDCHSWHVGSYGEFEP